MGSDNEYTANKAQSRGLNPSARPPVEGSGVGPFLSLCLLAPHPGSALPSPMNSSLFKVLWEAYIYNMFNFWKRYHTEVAQNNIQMRASWAYVLFVKN